MTTSYQPSSVGLQGTTETLLSGLGGLYKKIAGFWQGPGPIADKAELESFLTIEIAKITGLAVMKYSQKRLGKIHYNLTKDENYAQELVDCQIKLHAEIVADMGLLIAQMLKLDNISQYSGLKSLLRKVHQDYVFSAPEGMNFKSCLKEHHFLKSNAEFRDIALKTGKFLFKTLPMTEIMLASDVGIFQGQIRFAYIHLLKQLGNRVNHESLRSCLT